MKNKISKVQIFRIIVQIAFLFILPGLFTLTFSEIGRLFSQIKSGSFNLVTAFPSLTAMVSVLIITIIFGRFFCGFMCAFGTYNDLIYLISNKLFRVKYRVNEKADAVLKYVKYLILIFIVTTMWIMESKAFEGASPWDAFASLPSFLSSFETYFLGFILLGLITIGAFFIERFFCRYLCPLGAIFTILSKVRIFNIKKPNSKCGSCKLCTNNCSMGIPLYKYNKVKSGECINCLKCTDACRRNNAKATILDENINPALASSIAIAAFAGVYSLTNAAGADISKINSSNVVSTEISNSSTSSNSSANLNSTNNASSSDSTSTSNSTKSSSTASYKDGTYTGTGRGFRPGLKVAVTIKSGKIAKVEIVSINDTPSYYNEPVNTLPSEIVKAQSANVDTVSGATRTSNGIIMAVQDALSQAKA